MRVPFNGKNVNVPEEYIERQKRALPELSLDEIVDMFLSDEGFKTNDEVIALGIKAKEAGTGAKADGPKAKRKPPARKPDEVKRALIEALFMSFVHDEKFKDIKSPAITNVERMIAFSIGNDNYELTLTKKRKPKE